MFLKASHVFAPSICAQRKGGAMNPYATMVATNNKICANPISFAQPMEH